MGLDDLFDDEYDARDPAAAARARGAAPARERDDRRHAVVLAVVSVAVAALLGGGIGLLVAAVRDDPETLATGGSPTASPAIDPTTSRAPSASATPKRAAPSVDVPEAGPDTGYLVSAVRREGSGEEGDVVELRFDRVQVLTGEEAERAATADGQELEGDTYVVNSNRKLRTLLLRSDAMVTGDAAFNDHVGDGSGPTRRSVDDLIDFVRTDAGQETLWDLRYDADDFVTDVTERYTA